MKYPFLESLIPEGEHFDASAIVNEGGWMSIGHIGMVERKGVEMQQAIADFAAAAANHQTALDNLTSLHSSAIAALNVTISEKDTAIGTLNETIGANQTLIDTQTATIAALEAQVVKLGGQSSGTGTTVPGAVDVPAPETPAPQASKHPRWDDPEHPANKGADQYLRSARK